MYDELHERLLDEVYRQIRDDLAEHGRAWVAISQLPITVEEWRRLARAAGRTLGRPVRTKVFNDQAVAARLNDWGRTREEYELRLAEDRELQLQLQAAMLERYQVLGSGED